MEAIVDEAAVVIDVRFRSESSVAPAINVFNELIWPGELPKPVIIRTPEELGIPRVVPDLLAPRKTLRPDYGEGGRNSSMRLAGAKKDRPVRGAKVVQSLVSPSCRPSVDTTAKSERKEESMTVTEELKQPYGILIPMRAQG